MKDKFKDIPLAAYGAAKQKWKDDGNYFTVEELAMMDMDETVNVHEPIEPSMDAN